MDKGTALGSGVACGRHHAVSSCESPSFASVFSPPQEKSQAQRIVPRKGRWPEAPADPPPAVNDGSSVVGGSPPRELKMLRHRWDTGLSGSHRGPFPSFPLELILLARS